MTVGRASGRARPARDLFDTVTLLESEHVRVLFAAFEPGQEKRTALEAVLRGHFEREARVYVPLLACFDRSESAAHVRSSTLLTEGHEH